MVFNVWFFTAEFQCSKFFSEQYKFQRATNEIYANLCSLSYLVVSFRLQHKLYMNITVFLLSYAVLSHLKWNHHRFRLINLWCMCVCVVSIDKSITLTYIYSKIIALSLIPNVLKCFVFRTLSTWRQHHQWLAAQRQKTTR